jgi:membrane associated rhomboid family serine protease
MFIPWGTDAPIYHWPWMTIVLIVTNVLVFFGVMNLPEETVTPLLLAHGQGLHPLQWVTSNFIHGNFEHLIGNMMFLWAFALVVEGKLGAFPFLAVYLGLGIAQCGLEQVLTLGMEEGASFGASAIIYGVMTMALVWAPKNDLDCIVFFRFAPSTFEIPILVFALLYLALEAVLVLATRFALSSALLHLSGAALGFVLATVMLKKDWVDCENWDLYAVIQGRKGQSKAEATRARRRTAPAPAPAPRKKAKRVQETEAPKSMEDRAAAALRRLRGHLDAGEFEAAFASYDKSVRTIPGWQPTGPDWLDLIKALNEAKLWPASVSVMEDYLRRVPDPSPRVRLKLAQILIREQQRPAHALRVLAEIREQDLPPSLAPLREQLTRQAEQMREEGVLELEGEAW